MHCHPFRKFIIRHTCCPFFDCTLLHLYRCFQTAAKACADCPFACCGGRKGCGGKGCNEKGPKGKSGGKKSG